MKKLLVTIFLVLPIFINAQNCNCKKNFQWVKKTFEENDAGFTYAIENKGMEAYIQHNKIFKQKVKNIKDITICTQVLYEWLHFFRSGHIGIQLMVNPNENNTLKKKDISKTFKNWKKLDTNIDEFKIYLDSKKENDFEGIWVVEPYEIGIKKVDNKYLGFIIKGDGVYWTEGQIKLEIDENSVIYYMRDHSAKKFNKAELISKNLIEIGFLILKRKYPNIKNEEKDIAAYIKTIETQEPYFEQLNKTTTLLRIPSFGWQAKQNIDSVISANKAIILNTPNLIIDIRNNGGGSDVCFSELLPILYTNPIRTVGIELLSTPLNNKRFLDMIDGKYGEISEDQKVVAQKLYDKLSKHIGKFVAPYEDEVILTEYDTTYKYPQNIGIIINEFNGSTTEQFLLVAKQSKKVKLFGTTTAGILDISNMYFVPSPCGQFQLAYCVSKSKRIPDMAIDNKGIQPDYYIDHNIPKYKWLNYVIEILNR